MRSQILWYTARASGIVAWVLATASVLWGLALSTRSTRVVGSRPGPAWVFDLHRFLGGIALTFTAIHVGSILLDSYVHFSLVNVLVPLTGTWHPVAVAWGIVALYALLAVELTSLWRSRIPKRLWRRIHFGSFLLFAVSTVHGLSAGTDGHSAVFVVAVLTACGIVGALVAVRLADALAASQPAPARRPAPARATPRSRATPVARPAPRPDRQPVS